MPNTVTIKEVKARLEDLLDQARRGEEWVITDAAGLPLAKLSAPTEDARAMAPDTGHATLFGLMKGQIELLPGWDDPLEDFEPYRQ